MHWLARATLLGARPRTRSRESITTCAVWSIPNANRRGLPGEFGLAHAEMCVCGCHVECVDQQWLCVRVCAGEGGVRETVWSAIALRGFLACGFLVLRHRDDDGVAGIDEVDVLDLGGVGLLNRTDGNAVLS